jgi:hypothetical protein
MSTLSTLAAYQILGAVPVLSRSVLQEVMAIPGMAFLIVAGVFTARTLLAQSARDPPPAAHHPDGPAGTWSYSLVHQRSLVEANNEFKDR